jgi:hypothetical protein
LLAPDGDAWSYARLSELQQVCKLGLGIEHDAYFSIAEIRVKEVLSRRPKQAVMASFPGFEHQPRVRDLRPGGDFFLVPGRIDWALLAWPKRWLLGMPGRLAAAAVANNSFAAARPQV